MNTKFAAFLSRLFEKEYNCVLCGRELEGKTRYRLCALCYQKLEVIGERACLKCGKMLFAEEEYCLDCQNHEKAFDRAIAPFCYSGGAAKLVTDLKFRGKRHLADAMARMMTDKLLESGLTADVVIPVPLHPNREKERGYNQSELLAREIASALNLPLSFAVRRVKDTLASSGLTGGRRAREENMKDAFVVSDEAAVKDKVALVVDDVLTTGATANEISSVLGKAKAKRVYVLTFANTREKAPIQEDS